MKAAVECTALLLQIRDFQNSNFNPRTCHFEVFLAFPRSLKANIEAVLQSTLRLLPLISLQFIISTHLAIWRHLTTDNVIVQPARVCNLLLTATSHMSLLCNDLGTEITHIVQFACNIFTKRINIPYHRESVCLSVCSTSATSVLNLKWYMTIDYWKFWNFLKVIFLLNVK